MEYRSTIIIIKISDTVRSIVLLSDINLLLIQGDIVSDTANTVVFKEYTTGVNRGPHHAFYTGGKSGGNICGVRSTPSGVILTPYGCYFNTLWCYIQALQGVILYTIGCGPLFC